MLARATSGRRDVSGGFPGSSRRRARRRRRRRRRRSARANARRRAEGETRGDRRERVDGFRDASTRRERRRASIERRVGGGDQDEDDGRRGVEATTKMDSREERRRGRGRGRERGRERRGETKSRGRATRSRQSFVSSRALGSGSGALSVGRSSFEGRAGVGAFDGVGAGGEAASRRARRGPSRRDRRGHERLRARRVRRPGVRAGERGRLGETPRGFEVRRRDEGGPSRPVVVARGDRPGDDPSRRRVGGDGPDVVVTFLGTVGSLRDAAGGGARARGRSP